MLLTFLERKDKAQLTLLLMQVTPWVIARVSSPSQGQANVVKSAKVGLKGNKQDALKTWDDSESCHMSLQWWRWGSSYWFTGLKAFPSPSRWSVVSEIAVEENEAVKSLHRWFQDANEQHQIREDWMCLLSRGSTMWCKNKDFGVRT